MPQFSFQVSHLIVGEIVPVLLLVIKFFLLDLDINLKIFKVILFNSHSTFEVFYLHLELLLLLFGILNLLKNGLPSLSCLLLIIFESLPLLLPLELHLFLQLNLLLVEEITLFIFKLSQTVLVFVFEMLDLRID